MGVCVSNPHFGTRSAFHALGRILYAVCERVCAAWHMARNSRTPYIIAICRAHNKLQSRTALVLFAICCIRSVCVAAPPDGLTLSARVCVMAFEGCTGREWCTRVLWQREEVSDGGERTSSTIDGRPRASARKFIGVLPTCD